MKKQLLASFLAVFLVAAAFGAGSTLAVIPDRSQSASAAFALPTVVIDDSALRAEAAILYDPNSGRVLYQKNAEVQLPLASLTKLMTAQAVLASQNPNTVVRITAADLEPEGDWGLREGDAVRLGDLLSFGLVTSCNDCLAAAAASLGDGYLNAMNMLAVRLNLTKSYFLNPTGLDESDRTAGAYGSAFDVARMTAGFYQDYPSLFEDTTHPSGNLAIGGRVVTAEATSLPLEDIPGFLGGKTGYTDLAGGNLAAVFDLEPGRPVVAAVLHSTETGRFEDIRTLIDAMRSQL